MTGNDLTSHHATGINPEVSLFGINWNEPKADAYLTQAAFQRGLSTSCWVQTESARNPQCQSRTCYQECGRH